MRRPRKGRELTVLSMWPHMPSSVLLHYEVVILMRRSKIKEIVGQFGRITYDSPATPVIFLFVRRIIIIAVIQLRSLLKD